MVSLDRGFKSIIKVFQHHICIASTSAIFLHFVEDFSLKLFTEGQYDFSVATESSYVYWRITKDRLALNCTSFGIGGVGTFRIVEKKLDQFTVTLIGCPM